MLTRILGVSLGVFAFLPVPQSAQPVPVQFAGPFIRHRFLHSVVVDCTVTITPTQLTTAGASTAFRIACIDNTVTGNVTMDFPARTPLLNFSSGRLIPESPFETSVRAIATGATSVSVRFDPLPGAGTPCATGDGAATCRHTALLNPVVIRSSVTIAFQRRTVGAGAATPTSLTISAASEYDATGPRLSFSPSTVELRGERGLPSNAAEVTLTNTGGAELRWTQPEVGLAGADPNRERFKVTPSSGTIPPNGSQRVTIQVNPCAILAPRQPYSERTTIRFPGNFTAASLPIALEVAPNDVNRFEILSLTPPPGQLQPAESHDFVMRARVSLGTHAEGGAMFLIRDAAGNSIDAAFPVRVTLNEAPREIEFRAPRVEIPAGVTAIAVTGILYSANPVLDNIVFATDPRQYRVSPDTLTISSPRPARGSVINARGKTQFSATVSAQLRSLPSADVVLALIEPVTGAELARSEPSRVTSERGLVELPLSFTAEAYLADDYLVVALLLHPETRDEVLRSEGVPYPHVDIGLIFGNGSGSTFERFEIDTAPILLFHRNFGFETIRVVYGLPKSIARDSARLSIEMAYRNDESRRRQPGANRVLRSSFPPANEGVMEVSMGPEIVPGHSDWIRFIVRVNVPGSAELIVESVEFSVERVYVVPGSISPAPDHSLPSGRKTAVRARVEYRALRAGLSNLYALIRTETALRISFAQRPIVAPELGETGISLEIDPDDRRLTLSMDLFAAMANMDLRETPESLDRGAYLGRYTLPPVPTPVRNAPGRQPLTGGAIFDQVSHALGDSTPIFTRRSATPINPASAVAAPSKSTRDAGTPADALQFRGIPVQWQFDPPIPAAQFSARLTLEFRDTPIDPSIDPSQLEIVSLDPATGALSRHPSTVDLASRSVSAPISGLETVYSIGTFATSRSQTVAIPFLAALSGLTVAQSLVNAANEPVQLQVALHGDSGNGEATPADAPANAQLLNPSAANASAGWLRIVSPSNTLSAASLLGAGALFDAMPVPPVHPGTHIFPHVEAGAGLSAELHLANNALLESVCDLRLREPGGASAADATLLLPGRGRAANRIEDLFPSLPLPFQGTLTATCGQETSSALVLRTDATLAALPGLRGLSRRWHAPYITPNATLHIVNAGALPVGLTLRAFGGGGADAASPQSLTLAPGQKATPSLSALLGPSPSGALLLESDRPGIAAAIEWNGNPAGLSKRSFAPLLDNPSNAALIPWIANSAGFSSTLAVSNTSARAATLDIRAFRAGGTMAGAARQSLAPNGHIEAPLATLIAATAGQAGGYLHLTADQPIAALLRMESATSLATLPSVEAPAGIVPAAPPAPPPPTPTPSIAITPAELDFGQVPAAQTRDLPLTVRNTGNAPLTISDATLANALFTLTPRPPVTLAPNEQRILTVRFAPTSAGTQAATLTLATNDPARRTVAVRITGTGIAPPAVNREFTLQLDDGTFEDVIGFPEGNVNAYFLVRFTPTRYPATLKKIQVYFHSTGDNLVAGDSIALLSGPHTAGEAVRNPAFRVTNARVLAAGRFNEYEVAPLTISSGDFLAGFSVFNRTRIFPMAVDTTRPQGRSYISVDGVDFRLLRGVSNLDGNHGIRAVIESPQ